MTIIFALFVYAMLIFYAIFPDIELSEWENRYLEMKPAVTLSGLKDGCFMRKYEDYTNDQLPFRDFFINVKALCETAMFKVENNGIAKGRGSYLFTKDIKGTDVFDRNIAAIGNFCESIPNSVKVAIAPNACGVLKNYVPKGFPIADQSKKLLQINADNSLLKGANVVDLYSAMIAHGDEYIYYRTDHHWTTLGAYYAYRAVSGSESPISLSELEWHEAYGFYGTLYAKYKGAFVTPDTLTFYDIPVKQYITDETERQSLYDMEKLDVFDKYGMFMCGNFGFSIIKSGVCENGKSLIVFKDSYANSLLPFLTYDYEDIYVIDLRYYKDSVTDFVSRMDGSDVLFLYNFDFLNEDNHFYKLAK